VGDGRESVADEKGARAFRAMSTPVPRRDIGSAGELLGQYAFLLDGGVFENDLMRACEVGSARRIAPHLLLIHSGVLSGPRYLELLQERLPAREVRHSLQSAGAGAGAGPAGVTEIVDALPLTPRAVEAAVREVRGRGNVALLLMPQQIDWSAPPETRRWRADQAANSLLRRRPEMSAGGTYATWQVVMAPVLPGLAFGGMLVAPWLTLLAISAVVTLPFLFIVGLRVISLLAVLRLPPPTPLPDLGEAELPVYSVIVPLFREANVVEGLVQSLTRLDYPAARLDVMLVTESADPATVTALRRIALPPHMRVLVVPDVPPRTKPKALNYALRQARGDYVVIYDAEDDPEPDQLRRALRLFKEGPGNLMCVQGRLALDNPRPRWIARQFMLEYAALFDAMLHALVRLRLPVPLGGTSNHFPRAALDALGGWDAYNVTEDADLGVRIARVGGVVAVLDSTTHEEAPDRLAIWLPQRTRWMKGFMQTWLVHMREPRRLWRELGAWGFIGFNAYLGGIVLSSLVHPIFLIALGWEALFGRVLTWPDTVLGSVLFGFSVFILIGGYVSGMVIAALAAKRRRLMGLLPHLVLMPVYWLLISVAAYRAVLQLMTKPYLWEKTPHSARDGRGA